MIKKATWKKIPLKGIRKAIAQNMLASVSQAPQVTVTEDVNISKLYKLRKKEKLALEKKGIKLTYLPFIIKASIATIKELPIFNSSIQGEEIIIKKYYNIGIATETPAGLMVPVVKDADNKTMSQIAKQIQPLYIRAKKRELSLEELKGSTFTITNYGSIGGIYATPIINPGESAILGIGRIFDREGRKILPLSLTFDHRVIDGAQASRFIEKVKTYLEDPDHLLI